MIFPTYNSYVFSYFGRYRCCCYCYFYFTMNINERFLFFLLFFCVHCSQYTVALSRCIFLFLSLLNISIPCCTIDPGYDCLLPPDPLFIIFIRVSLQYTSEKHAIKWIVECVYISLYADIYDVQYDIRTYIERQYLSSELNRKMNGNEC